MSEHSVHFRSSHDRVQRLMSSGIRIRFVPVKIRSQMTANGSDTLISMLDQTLFSIHPTVNEFIL